MCVSNNEVTKKKSHYIMSNSSMVTWNYTSSSIWHSTKYYSYSTPFAFHLFTTARQQFRCILARQKSSPLSVTPCTLWSIVFTLWKNDYTRATGPMQDWTCWSGSIMYLKCWQRAIWIWQLLGIHFCVFLWILYAYIKHLAISFTALTRGQCYEELTTELKR